MAYNDMDIVKFLHHINFIGVCGMQQETFYQLAQEQRFQISEGFAFGVYRGWPLLFACMGRGANANNGRPVGVRVLLSVSININKLLLRQIQKNAKRLFLRVYLLRGRELQIWFSDKSSPDDFYPVLNQMLDFLTEHQLTPPTACPFCHAKDCDVAVAWRSTYLPAHRTCVEHAVQSQKNVIEKNDLNGSYVTGFLGGLIGSFIAVLPSLLFVWATGSVSGWLLALIPIISYKGYQFAHGRLNRSSIAIPVLLSLLQVFVIIETSFYHIVVNHYNLYPSIFVTIALSFQQGAFLPMLNAMWLSLAFMPIGILISFAMLANSGTPHIKALDDSLSTIFPYHPGAGTGTNAPAPARITLADIEHTSTSHFAGKDPWDR